MVEANGAVAAVMGDLTTAIDQVSTVISANMERSETAAVGIREAMEVVENVAAISEENAASAERVAETTADVSRQAQEVQDAARALTGIARELEGSTARFKIDRDEDEPASATATPPPALKRPVGVVAPDRPGNGRRDVKAA
jgi:methyl-accepting chemotaxis protein